jgi:hypothetical protein
MFLIKINVFIVSKQLQYRVEYSWGHTREPTVAKQNETFVGLQCRFRAKISQFRSC